MKRPHLATVILLGLMLVPLAASAASIKAFVDDFSFTPPGTSDLKSPLKTLLISRFSGEGITTVEKASEADVVVSGSYTQLGKVFSLDAVVKTTGGKQIGSAFEQGDAPDGVIPSVGRVAAKLKEVILKGERPVAATQPVPPPTSTTPPTPAQVAATVPAPAAAAAIAPPAQPGAPLWMSQRVAGAQETLSTTGADLLITSSGKTIRLYRKGTTLTQVAEAEVGSLQKIVALDATTDPSGKTLLYVSIVQAESAASRVYLAEPNGLKLLGDNLPYLFRSVATYGGPRKLYAQQLMRGDYFGDVFEAQFDGKGGFEVKNPIKMPRYASVLNFNLFRDQSGKSFLTAFSEGGYLVVYSDQGEELWRSEEKFGGSENFFMRRDSDHERFFGNPNAPRFIEQRISVAGPGAVIVPQNDGFFVLGNSRTYSKYSMVVLVWNGAALEERWRSKQTPNYLADYSFDPASQKLTLLEMTQHEGIFGKGASLVKVIQPELP